MILRKRTQAEATIKKFLRQWKCDMTEEQGTWSGQGLDKAGGIAYI